MASELQFEVPLIPPSVNHYKKPKRLGGWFRSKEADAFIAAVCIFSRKQPVDGKLYEVEITFHLALRDFMRFDVDNFCKVSLDALMIAGVIRDDRYVSDLEIHKRGLLDQTEARTCYLIRGKETL